MTALNNVVSAQLLSSSAVGAAGSMTAAVMPTAGMTAGMTVGMTAGHTAGMTGCITAGMIADMTWWYIATRCLHVCPQ